MNVMPASRIGPNEDDMGKELSEMTLEHNRDAYTNAKTVFISKWTAEALKEYGDRY